MSCLKELKYKQVAGKKKIKTSNCLILQFIGSIKEIVFSNFFAFWQF